LAAFLPFDEEILPVFLEALQLADQSLQNRADDDFYRQTSRLSGQIAAF
jgi:hypothetical protein